MRPQVSTEVIGLVRALRAAMFGPVMVRFENVGMRYGPGPEVLRDVTFVLEAGSFTFLTGPVGRGQNHAAEADAAGRAALARACHAVRP